MPATGTAADAGRTLDAFLKLNTSVGNVKRTANSAVQSIKINGATKTATAGVVDLGTITGTSILLLELVGGVWYRDHGATTQKQFTPPSTRDDASWAAFAQIEATFDAPITATAVPAWMPLRARLFAPEATA